MKLLLDNDPFPHIVASLQSAYPDTAHVHDLDPWRAPDERVCEFAKSRGFVIASKDADFHQRSLVYGPPPKAIWIRLGNCSVDQTLSVLLEARPVIERFVADEHATFLAIPRANAARRG